MNHSENCCSTYDTKINVARVHDGQLYANLFENSHTIMLIIDPDTATIVDANSAATDFYCYEKLELTQMKITEINIMPNEQIFEEMEKAKTKQRNYFNFRHRVSDGEVKDVEVYSGPIVLAGKKLLYSIIHDVSERKERKRGNDQESSDLEQTDAGAKTLHGVLPICSSCKRIRDDRCQWHPVEEYIRDHSEADFTHGLCPECYANFFLEVEDM